MGGGSMAWSDLAQDSAQRKYNGNELSGSITFLDVLEQLHN
jgi:hypothetical protein